jgi:hypothetical protein
MGDGQYESVFINQCSVLGRSSVRGDGFLRTGFLTLCLA